MAPRVSRRTRLMTRRGHRTKRIANAITQLPWRDVVNPYGPTEVLNAEQIERIIDGALTILESQGMRFLEPASRKALKNAGADVDEETRMVRFDRQLITQMLGLAPRSSVSGRATPRIICMLVGIIFSSRRLADRRSAVTSTRAAGLARTPRCATSCAWCRV